MTTTSIERNGPVAGLERPQGLPVETAGHGQSKGGAESALRVAARRRGLTMRELAAKMGTTPSYLSSIATGSRPWTPRMREKAEAVLGEVPGQGIVYRQGGVVSGESSYIRESARELGMSMQDLAERAGVSYGYMVQVSRGHRNMGVKVQARVESALDAPAKITPARCADVDRQAVWEADERPRHQPERGGPAGWYQLRPSLSDHVGRQDPVAWGAEEAARRALPADAGGAGDARRGEGAGLAERREEGDGREGRRWAWARRRRRRRAGRRPRPLGCEGGVRLSHRVRRAGPSVGHPRGRAGLLRHADAASVRGLVLVYRALCLARETEMVRARR